MSILTFPAISRLPEAVDWSLMSNTQTFISPLNKTVQTVEMPGARWRFNFTIELMDEVDAALYQAFLVRLRGSAGRFYMWNLGRPTPRGAATGVPVVAGASQTGTSLVTGGWTASTAGIMLAGDYFSVNDELKMVVQDAASDSSGNATLVFEPPLRRSPDDAAAVTTLMPTAVFRMEADEAAWTTRAPILTDITLSAVEAFT